MAGRVVVMGSSGFIGGQMCKEAATRGLSVLGLSRSGTMPPYLVSHSSGDMASRVTFAKADAGTPATYTEHLQGASAVIISVGAPPVPNWFYAGGKAESIKSNGTVCAQVIAAASAAQVPRVVLVNATMPAWLQTVSSGYATGKLMAEASAQHYASPKTQVVCLKPGLVFGTRYAGEAQLPVPIGWVIAPLRLVLRLPVVDSAVDFLRTRLPYLFGNLLAEPVAVEELARTAIDMATRDNGTPFVALGPEEIIRRSHKQGLANLTRT